MRLLFGCFLLMFCVSCSKPAAQKATAVILDSNTVTFSGGILNYDALKQLKQETLSREEWTNVLPVMLLPLNADKGIDGEEQILGIYTLNDTAIVFKAQIPFEKHREYIARFYSSDAGLSYVKLVQSKQNLRGPQQTDYSFKVN